MSDYRNMRLLLMFDLPTIEDYEKKEYANFRKCIIKNGYYMLQFSVYTKCVNTQTKVEQELNKIKQFLPTNGNVRIITITEKQFINMAILLGKKNINEVYNNQERYVKI